MGRSPRVLAFVHDWQPAEDAAIRAQLRGLGAELVIRTPTATYAFGPDDIAERSTADYESEAVRFDVDPRDEAVFVLDEHDAIRFSHRPPGKLDTSLAEALQMAHEAMHARSAPITFSRREWLTSCLVAGFTFAVLPSCKSKDKDTPQPAPEPPKPDDEIDITLDVNGRKRTLRVEPRVSLLDALRERLALPGTKKGCDAGQCGACTVLVGGSRVLSCLTLAVMAQGKPIQTIEGLALGDELHPMQAAFIEHDALQCGFCTPGQIMSAVGMIHEGHAKTDDDVREQMSGNICRCGAYPNIVSAVRAVQKRPG